MTKWQLLEYEESFTKNINIYLEMGIERIYNEISLNEGKRMEAYKMIFDKIKEIIIDQLQVEESEVTMDTNLMKDLSADSLDAVEIIMAIEDEYGIEIPDEDAEKFQTVRDLVKYVEEVKQQVTCDEGQTDFKSGD